MEVKSPRLAKTFVSRHITYREIQRVIKDGDTENTAIGASFETVKNTKELVAHYGTSKRIVKKLKSYRQMGKGHNIISGTKNAFKAEIKKTIRNTIKNSGISVVEGVYTAQTTDSTVNSVSLSIKSSLGAKETFSSTHSSLKKGIKVYKHINNAVKTKKNPNVGNTSQSKVLKPQNPSNHMASKVGKKGKQVHSTNKKYSGIQTAIRKSKIQKAAKATTYRRGFEAASRIVQAVKMLFTNPQTLLMVGLAAGILILFVSITSSVSNFASLPSTFVMADESVAKQYVNLINKEDKEMADKIESYKNDSNYDDVVIEWMNEIGEVKTNWQEIISLVAVKREQDLTFSFEEQSMIKQLYDRMNFLKTRTEIYYCSGCKSSAQGGLYCPGHIRLYVQVYSLDMEEIIDDIGFEEWQKDWARNLVVADWASLYPGIANSSGTEMSAAEIKKLMTNSPTSSATREQIRKTALSLVGKVDYFWGGKSSAGWNNQWGKSVKVTALGSSSTGTYQPYGLDCSGFTDWVYKTAGVGNIISGGSSYQWSQSYEITKSDLKVGDLVFKSKPGTSGVNHVGIYVGKDSSGNNLYCHCAWSQGVVVNSYKGFKYFRRPFIKFEGE